MSSMVMKLRGAAKHPPRPKSSLGNLRRAHPASGATWNVQVVRGKMTTRCLWHACRALVLGMVLMLLGGGMATIGYYANDFSMGAEFKGNTTIRVKNENRGLHLNNLSYVGPIIMGVGGFIVVAACVMTFEARDSAAKVVPARFKLSGARNNTRSGSSTNRRNTAFQSGQGSNSQTSTGLPNRWEQHLGVFRTSHDQPKDRKALTAALVHFSKALGSPGMSPELRDDRRFSRSGSVPNLAGMKKSSGQSHSGSPGSRSSKRHNRELRNRSLITRSTRETSGGFLHPGTLHLYRQALSVEENGPYMKHYSDSTHGSQGSVSFDPHTCIINPEIAGVHKHRERTKRSDTAKRHVLSRQKPIEKEEPHSPKTGYSMNSRRRSSTTISDVSILSRKARIRRASTSSRTASIDSRGVGAASNSSTIEINDLHTPEKQATNSPRRAHVITQFSTPSVEKEFRSQLSICSEPPLGVRGLSCQSSIEPCVPEEDSPDQDEYAVVNEKVVADVSPGCAAADAENILRPDTLQLSSAAGTTEILSSSNNDKNLIKNINDKQKFLYRSNSTKSFKKPKVKTKAKLSNEFDQIYVISSSDNCNKIKDDDLYDSIDVIHERRIKNFSKFNDDDAASVTGSVVAASSLCSNEIIECHNPPNRVLETEGGMMAPAQEWKDPGGGEAEDIEANRINAESHAITMDTNSNPDGEENPEEMEESKRDE